MSSSIFYGFGTSDDGNISVGVCSDPKLEYEFVLDPTTVTNDVEWLDTARVDYNLVLPGHKGTYLEELGVPLSFLDIRTVDEGIQWYNEHTDMPDCMLPYLAEYHWGKPVTAPPSGPSGSDIAVPEPAKKKKKKPVPVMEIKQGKFRIEFD
jgi:hypothetical protein